MYISTASSESENPVIRLVDNWQDLAGMLNIPVKSMSYTLLNREKLQKRIRLGERTVYQSAPILRGIQTRIMHMVTELYDALPNTECAIAYRKGLTPTDVLEKIEHPKMLITLDIRKYYDNVTLQHLTDALVHCGFTPRGGRLVSRYCVVNTGRMTLQQGSPASPVLSNLVGYFNFDVPVQAWLREKYPDLACEYIRYCDNIALAVMGEPPEGFREEFKAFVVSTFRSNGFRTHKWNCISDNNPKKNQRFLGVIINKKMRADLAVVDRLRAILFNWARFGTKETVNTYLSRTNTGCKHPAFDVDELLVDRFASTMRGHITYISRISEDQGNMLKKLFKAAKLLDSKNVVGLREREDVFAAVKAYRNKEQSLEDYIEQLTSTISAA